MTSSVEPLLDVIDRLRETDPRFRREAYLFVVAALGHAVERLSAERRGDPLRRHLHGSEVVGSAVDLARTEFGPLAATVFREWGVQGGRDIGVIVFQLVDAGQLSATPDDRLEDFLEGPDLLSALSVPAPPAARRHGGA